MKRLVLILCAVALVYGCGTSGEVVQVTTVSDGDLKGIGEENIAQLDEIIKARKKDQKPDSIDQVLEKTPQYTLDQYLKLSPEANNPSALDYKVGGYDVIDINVYEEADLSRKDVRISADGYISFPLVGRLQVEGLNTSEIEKMISEKLAQGQYLLDAHVSVTVTDYKSKQFMVLGAVKEPGSYPLKAKERVLDAISRAGGIVFENVGKQVKIIRTVSLNAGTEKKVVVSMNVDGLLKGGAQFLLQDKDLIYIPKAEHFYIIGQVTTPGSYLYQQENITLVEAISMAGGFTPIAARNKTRIVRVEDGIEKIIQVQVDAITKSGKKTQDVKILPGDVIVVPESFF
ncbi:MAG: polysaccharide export protein [Desulfobacterales bacterium]|nr:polysaccharide export protein [Desulfobacterales bacterium]